MSPQERWTAFLAKVAARADEIEAEADAGFDELIAMQVLDTAPLSAALTEFHARMLGLGRKIDEAWQKIDAELDAPHERSALVELGRRTTAAIDRKSKVLQVTKAAKAARELWKLAELEIEKVRTQTLCAACGAPLVPVVFHEASNATCPHCKAVAVLRPGIATLLYFGGSGLHATGEHAALDESARLEAAILTYQATREKRRRDVDAWVAAHRAYWLVYARGYGTHVPGWNETKSKALAEAKLGALKWELDRVQTVD
jgi:hypothetical protein